MKIILRIKHCSQVFILIVLASLTQLTTAGTEFELAFVKGTKFLYCNDKM
jgi:hypothetical protein